MGLLRILRMNSNKKIDLELDKEIKIPFNYYICFGGSRMNVSLKRNPNLKKPNLKGRYAKLYDHEGTFIVDSLCDEGDALKLRRKNIPRGYKGDILILTRQKENK